jgi:toxin FitB
VNVVDSSGWLEYLSDGPNAHHFAEPLLQPDALVVPVISVYEVFKRTLQQRGVAYAFRVAGLMYQGEVVPLNGVLAVDAARLSSQLALPMADSIILATATAHDATL